MKKIQFVILFSILPASLFSMHIMEGFLPIQWAAAWWAAVVPALYLGIVRIKKILAGNPELKMLLAMCGAFAFFLSALKLPSVTGSSSHPTGLALGAILFGPAAMVVVGFTVLVFQCLLLAHGGITTLGANAVAMAVFGPLAAYSVYRGCQKMKINKNVSIFLAAFFGDVLTYGVTAVQLALAHPDARSGFMGALVKFLSIFAVTQIPIAVSEGILTVIVIGLVSKYTLTEMRETFIMKPGKDLKNAEN